MERTRACSIIWQRYGKRERFSVAILPQKRSQAPAACNLPFVLVKYGTFVSAQLITSESAMIHTAIVHLLRLFAPMRLHSIHTLNLCTRIFHFNFIEVLLFSPFFWYNFFFTIQYIYFIWALYSRRKKKNQFIKNPTNLVLFTSVVCVFVQI